MFLLQKGNPGDQQWPHENNRCYSAWFRFNPRNWLPTNTGFSWWSCGAAQPSCQIQSSASDRVSSSARLMPLLHFPNHVPQRNYEPQESCFSTLQVIAPLGNCTFYIPFNMDNWTQRHSLWETLLNFIWPSIYKQYLNEKVVFCLFHYGNL